MDFPSGELACGEKNYQRRAVEVIGESKTYDVLAEIRVGERHDSLERIWTRTMGNDGDIVCSGHPGGKRGRLASSSSDFG